MPSPAFQLFQPPVRSSPVIFASPHSGRDYPLSFLRSSMLDQRTIRSSEDAFVDILFDTAPLHGAPLLCATAPRAYLDLNRANDELDPALIDGVRRSVHNPRVSSGLGVVPRVVANGRAIYRGKLSLDEAQRRLNELWQPYHDQLAALLAESRMAFGEAILIDCHSMPHEAIDSIAHPHGLRPDVVLGDRFGASARGDVVDMIEAAFASAGLSVVRNAPFAGAYTTQAYGRPSLNQHVVQIEIDRALYMDEALIRPNGNFRALKALLTKVIAQVTGAGQAEVPLAAE